MYQIPNLMSLKARFFNQVFLFIIVNLYFVLYLIFFRHKKKSSKATKINPRKFCKLSVLISAISLFLHFMLSPLHLPHAPLSISLSSPSLSLPDSYIVGFAAFRKNFFWVHKICPSSFLKCIFFNFSLLFGAN